MVTSATSAAAAQHAFNPVVDVRAGCRAQLCGLVQRPDLNGEEVAVMRWHAASQRWVVCRLSDSESMTVAPSKLVVGGTGLHEWLGANEDESTHAWLLDRILACHQSDAWTLGRAAAVSHSFGAAAEARLARHALARLTRRLPCRTACVEMAAPRAADVLALMCDALETMAATTEEHGGWLHSLVCAGPVLHLAQDRTDKSCAYRSAQMVISNMIAQQPSQQRQWPAARHVFLDVAATRRSARAVPSVRRLQRTIKEAWREGWDADGASQLAHTTMHCAEPFGDEPRTTDGGLAVEALPPLPPPPVPAGGGSASAASSSSATDSVPATVVAAAAAYTHDVLEYAGGPTVQPKLKLMGASDVWAMLRWVGTCAELHDFIDGPEDEATASDLLFRWVWDHLDAHAAGSGGAHGRDRARGGIHRCQCPPLYLQWAGHAVCIVGACHRKMHRNAPPERHLLIFNPIRTTEQVLSALSATSGLSDPHAQWWSLLAWTANRIGPRVTREQVNSSESQSSETGPGGEAGPYQILVMPAGWAHTQRDRMEVRSPEDACTQHIGNAPPLRCRPFSPAG